MKKVSMSGSLRENVGKKDAKKQRAEGKVVCVLYGGEEQIHFTVDNNAFNKIIFSPDVFVVDLEIDGKNYSAILQDVQYHPVSDRTLHADFLQLLDGKAVVISLPVKLEGVAPGVIKGGVLNKKLRNIPVKGMVNDMPDRITVDISKLNIGDTIQIKDVDFGGLECQLKESLLVVGVKTARGAVDEDEEDEDEDGEGEASGEEAPAAE
jgi:large subunit ribosomal protein L25